MHEYHRRRSAHRVRTWTALVLGLSLSIGVRIDASSAADTSLAVVANSPGNGSIGASGTEQILIRFNAPLARNTPLPVISPVIDGRWTRVVRQLVFTPGGAWAPNSTVNVTIPGGPTGVTGADGSKLRRDSSFSFEVTNGSLLRAQELLARLNYLPVSWRGSATPTLDEYQQAAFDPPRGRFSFIGQAPPQLRVLWKTGVATRVWTGALSTFENENNLPADGVLSEEVWAALLLEARHPTGYRSAAGYTFAVANQTSPETLAIWRDGTVVLNTLANTGISLAPTANGLYAIYAKLKTQIMKGTDPSGKKYADPVSYVSYFNGSDAVHYFDRSSYGFRQSLGCVEVPLVAAERSFGFLKIGTLISVIN